MSLFCFLNILAWVLGKKNILSPTKDEKNILSPTKDKKNIMANLQKHFLNPDYFDYKLDSTFQGVNS